MAGLKLHKPSPINTYYIPASDGGVLGIGDCVIKTGTSNSAEVRDAQGVHAPGTLMEVARATSGDGNKITGVVVSVGGNPADNEVAYRKASTLMTVQVADHPDAIFSVDADAAMAITDAGLNTNLVGSAGVDVNSGEANVKADADASADASNQLLIVGLEAVPGNKYTNAAPKLLVKINQHTESQGTVGALGI